MTTVTYTLPQLQELLRTAVRNHGEAWAARWLAEEIVKQPLPFLRAFMEVGREEVTEHNDVCACGHAKCRHDHRDGFVTTCVARHCGCQHFTWKQFGDEAPAAPAQR